MASTQPWLEKKAWKDNRIFSNAKVGMYVIWGFTLIWNLITLPIFLTNDDIYRKIESEPITALIFAFPAIGIMLIFMSIKSLNNWRRFGATPLQLSPFPGSLSGHVGGRIENRIPYNTELKYKVTLCCLRSYESGSGKDRKRSESVRWQTEGVCFSEPTMHGTKISFRFDVPGDLPESEPKNTSTYHLWRVLITCELPGTDYERQFEIPVYQGERHSDISKGTEDYHLTVNSAEDGLYQIAQIDPIPGGLEIYYPLLKRPSSGVVASIAGAVFASIGYFMWHLDDAPIIFPLTFTPIGLTILAFGIWSLGKSLRVIITRDQLNTRRFFLKYPITSRSVPTDDVIRLELKEGASSTTGNKTTVYYSLIAHTRNQEKIIIAERLSSKPEAKLISETLEGYFKNLDTSYQ